MVGEKGRRSTAAAGGWIGMIDIRECIPETKPVSQLSQARPLQPHNVGHTVFQLGVGPNSVRDLRVEANWIRIETDHAVDVTVNGSPVLEGDYSSNIFQGFASPLDGIYHGPLAWEYTGPVSQITVTLRTELTSEPDFRGLVHVYWSKSEHVRVGPGRPHCYVVESVFSSGWTAVVRAPIHFLPNQIPGAALPAIADRMYPFEIEVTGMGIDGAKSPGTWGTFELGRLAIVWRDPTDVVTLREFVRAGVNNFNPDNMSCHVEVEPVRIPIIAHMQSSPADVAFPLHVELRSNGIVAPDDLIFYANYRVVG